MDEKQRDAILAMLQRRTGEHTKSIEQAKRWLADEGLLDEDGELRPQYGGDGKDQETP